MAAQVLRRNPYRDVVYFIKAEFEDADLHDWYYFKIGISNDFNTRLIALQKGCPLRLTPINVISLASKRESEIAEFSLHSYFDMSGQQLTGEWFWLTPIQIEWCARLDAESLMQFISGLETIRSVDPVKRKIGRPRKINRTNVSLRTRVSIVDIARGLNGENGYVLREHQITN